MQRQARGHIQAVGFVFFHGAQVFFAFLDDHMTGGTGAGTAAGMFEMKAEVFREIKDAHGQAVAAVGHLAGLPFVHTTVVQKSELGHDFSIALLQ
jgi:hypothetical protein